MSITRKAIIIGCPDVQGLTYLKGAKSDLTNLEDFLMSDSGGRWFANEIVILENPEVEEVFETINEVSAEYSFVTFAGHGFISAQDNLTYLSVADGDISESDLITNASRQTLFIDSCRGVLSEESEMIKKAMFEEFRKGVTYARDIFDDYIEQCEKGIIKIFSANVDESAGESNIGGHFTLSFIKAAQAWASGKSNENNVLNLKNGFKLAISYMKSNYDTLQNPQLSEGRRMKSFPFAVRNLHLRG